MQVRTTTNGKLWSTQTFHTVRLTEADTDRTWLACEDTSDNERRNVQASGSSAPLGWHLDILTAMAGFEDYDVYPIHQISKPASVASGPTPHGTNVGAWSRCCSRTSRYIAHGLTGGGLLALCPQEMKQHCMQASGVDSRGNPHCFSSRRKPLCPQRPEPVVRDSSN